MAAVQIWKVELLFFWVTGEKWESLLGQLHVECQSSNQFQRTQGASFHLMDYERVAFTAMLRDLGYAPTYVQIPLESYRVLNVLQDFAILHFFRSQNFLTHVHSILTSTLFQKIW